MSHRHTTWVAAAADATDPNDFGGLPYHLVAAGKSRNVIEGGFGFNARTRKIQLARLLWNAGMLARTGRAGGFQYSETFLNLLWSSVERPLERAPILNVFQLYPERVMNTLGPKYFYLDQTLHEVFDYYGAAAKMSPAWRAQVLERENRQYREADRVIFRSGWAAAQAIANYGLDERRVDVVLPGANLDANALAEFDDASPEYSERGPLRLIFIGKDWYRKGLDRLLRAMRLASKDGANVALTVIGTREADLPKKAAEGLNVAWRGFIDKSRHPSDFIRLVARHDVGVLLSRSEAGGVSLREFGRLGLPVIAPATGGSPEFAMSKAARLVAPEDSDEMIAQHLINLAGDRRRLRDMQRDAWSRRMRFDWGMSVDALAKIL